MLFVIFQWQLNEFVYYLLNLIKCSVKTTITEKNTGKWEKILEKSGNFCQSGKVGTLNKQKPRWLRKVFDMIHESCTKLNHTRKRSNKLVWSYANYSCVATFLRVRVHLYLSESNNASKWGQRKSNLMFTFRSDKYQRKNSLSLSVSEH